MTKEEMKNKYSAFITEISEILGLGKPVDILKLCATTDLFFRPLEKRIEELEKENKVLAQNLEDTEILNKTYEKRFDDLKKENAELRNNGFTVSAMTEQQLKVALEKGEQLEKENAELKEKNRSYEQLIDNGSVTLAKERLKNYKQLTNAKEIISEFMKYEINEYDGSLEIHFEELKKQAEQFLSEVEK